MNWLKKRFGETSTYTGLAVVGSVLTLLAGPEGVQQAAPWVALIAGAIQAAAAEKGSR